MPAKNYNKYMREYMLRRYHKRRAEAYKYLGSVCVKCGKESDLELDHIDPSTKSFPIAKMWSVSKDRFWAEVKKCQLLCNSCHKEKTSAESKFTRPITHGKYWAAYKYKCTCDKCILFKDEYNRKRRAKRKNP